MSVRLTPGMLYHPALNNVSQEQQITWNSCTARLLTFGTLMHGQCLLLGIITVWFTDVVLPAVCSNIKTIKGDLIPYLVRQQFTDKKMPVASADTDWGICIFMFVYLHIYVHVSALLNVKPQLWSCLVCVRSGVWHAKNLQYLLHLENYPSVLLIKVVS